MSESLWAKLALFNKDRVIKFIDDTGAERPATKSIAGLIARTRLKVKVDGLMSFSTI